MHSLRLKVKKGHTTNSLSITWLAAGIVTARVLSGAPNCFRVSVVLMDLPAVRSAGE